MLETLPFLIFALLVRPPHLLRWSLALKCAREFANEAKAFAFFILALKSSNMICILQPLHPLDLDSPCSNFLIDFQHDTNVATLALSSRPRQGLARLWAKREAQRSHFMFLGVQKSVKEWILTLPNEFPFWSWSQWTPGSSEGDCRGQNPLDWKVLHDTRNLLKLRCLKWARMTRLDIWNTSYGQRKGRESNWQFDSRPLQVKNQPNFLACRWCATYHWKAFDEGYNFSLDLISIKGLHTKLWGPKVMEILILGISKLPFGSLGTKCHLDVSLMKRHIVYYKGEGGGFPQVRAMVSLVSSSLLVIRPSTKSAPIMH